MFHSLASTHTQYNKDAFDNFDIVLCAGPHHYKEIRKSEEYYKTKRKKLFKYGYPRLEEIKSSITNKKKINIKKTILIAPSWGLNSITNLCIFEILENLLNSNFNIIYRPHNMSLKKDKKIIKNIISKYSKFNNFEFDNSNYSFKNLLTADLLIADWGSTAADFALGLTKPVIFIDLPPKIKNRNFKEISSTSFEFEIRNKIGHIITKDKINLLQKIIIQIFNDKNSEPKKNNEFINEFIYNFLDSNNKGAAIIDQILKI